MKKYIGYGVGALLAAIAIFVFGQPVTDALKIATDKEAAKVFCAQVIDGEQKAE